MESSNTTVVGESRTPGSNIMECEVLENLNKSTTPLHAPGLFPDPLVIQPLLEHKQTFIILHGRGSFATRFGPPLLATNSSNNNRLQDEFPCAKIIFPTASRNRATIYKRSYTHQWFDNWHLEDDTKRQDLIAPVLTKSCEYLRELIKHEIKIVGAENVVLWGLSQGCATALSLLLTWDAEPFAAMVGMCGFLPFSNVIKDIAEGNTFPSSDDPFSQDEAPPNYSESEAGDGKSSKCETNSAAEALHYLREELQLGKGRETGFKSIPVFLGHGEEDQRVSIRLGREAKYCLDLLGLDAQMMAYEGLGHWYSPAMMGDIFQFLRERLGI